MPRPLRIEYENAWYHVMNRGGGYRDIYTKKKHREIFLNVLAESVQQFGIEIHAYCLMDNHYHLLVMTPRSNLSRAMRHINGVYTQRFNKEEKTDGPLFRGRYKAILVQKDSYLLQVSRYIHLNPQVPFLEKYLWSSYPGYLDKKRKELWLKTNEILSMVNNKVSSYRKFVESGLDEETKTFYERKKLPIIFGKKQFRKQMLKDLNPEKRKFSQPDYKQVKDMPTLNEVAQNCAAYFKINEKELFKVRRGRENEARKIAIYGSRVWAGEKLSKIAEHYNCQSHANISNTIRRINERLKLDVKFSRTLREICKLFC